MKTRMQNTPNLRLRQERLRHHWSQQALADRLGTTTANVSRWERGLTLPGPHFSLLLCDLFEKSADALGLIPEGKEKSGRDASDEMPATDDHEALSTAAPQEAPGPVWYVPYRRNLYFTGREQILTHLHTTLHNEQAIAHIQALSGLGGVGKTQTALEYAYRFRHDYHAVLWARAETRTMLTTDFLGMAEVLDLAEKADQDQQRVIKAVRRWLSEHTNWLLILDNVEDSNLARDFLPLDVKGHVLLTTQAHSVGTLAQRIDVKPMEHEEGTLLLLRRAKLLAPDASLQEADETLYQEAQQVYQLMDGLPLALDQAGAYIEETQCRLDEFLALFQAHAVQVLNEQDTHSDHPNPVTKTFALAFEKIRHSHPAAAEVLTACAFLAPDAIPEDLLLQGAAVLSPSLEPVAADLLQWNAMLKVPLMYSLLYRSAQSKTLAMHRLVQMVLRGHLDKETQRQWGQRITRLINGVLPDGEDGTTWTTWQRYLPHALQCSTLIAHWSIVTPEAGRILLQAGIYLREHARYSDAELLLQQAIALHQQLFGENHPQTAVCLVARALLCTRQSDFAQAEALHQQALAIQEQILGPEHIDVAENLSGLGELFLMQRKYAQAESCFTRALHIREIVLPPDHTKVAEGYNNLAVVYEAQGKYAQSEEYHLKVLHIWERILEPDHLYLAVSLNNLGCVYRSQGKYQQAEPLFYRALSIYEQAMGANNNYVVDTLTALATLSIFQANYAQAGSLLQRAIDICDQLGEICGWRKSVAVNYQAMIAMHLEEYDQAESLFQQALTLVQQIVGPEHLFTIGILSNVGALAIEQGHFSRAEELLQRTLRLTKQKIGQEHADVAKIIQLLAVLSMRRGDHAQAEHFYLQTLSLRERLLEPEHPHLAESLAGLAELYMIWGRYEESEQLYQRALSIREQRLRPDHPDTRETRQNLALLLMARKAQEAKRRADISVATSYGHGKATPDAQNSA
jgi:tetratricopeptide (TPR) repeat protein/transcriptional regulator with XRE-family HTH domain